MKEKLAAEDSHIIAEASASAAAAAGEGAGDIPSDSPSLAASSETPDAEAVAASAAPITSSKDAGVADDGGVLLEPGVASVEELFDSDVFSKSPVSRSGKKGETDMGTDSKPHDVEASEEAESKEKLRA